ncbi:hypothetical protein [Chryseobacterium rhizosphaerae]|uniref:DUF1634 domain-containing protein n=1 Tax=Chryseobacterium rhizosphaerae TaxID=395937 RepID=A0ABX9IRP0_9FLAO|nr:hypothetical protein [Chryseobacterium rhizosphaerae]REC78955.1 hypothetical protein DRF57_01375 [Chryseobacterium rhizosphaerae]
MKNSSNTITGTLTLFFVLGLLSILIGIIFSIIAFDSVSAQDGLAGMYALFGLIPVVIIIMIIDRICVWKWGPKKVNKVQFYIAGIFIVLFILNWIRLQLQ